MHAACMLPLMTWVAMLALQLRKHEARLAELVDMVVEGYHPGFARSIQNYSQILQLFQDSREQVHQTTQQLPFHKGSLSAEGMSAASDCWVQ